MAEQSQPDLTTPPSRAQNIFALVFTFVVLAIVVLGGWYMRSRNRGSGGAGASMQMSQGKGSSAAQSPLQIGNLTAQVKGEFRMPQSEINLEFKNAQGQPVDVGKVQLNLDMNMPGMVMHDAAEVRGSGGRYTARVKPQMAGDWTAKLSYTGPQ